MNAAGGQPAYRGVKGRYRPALSNRSRRKDVALSCGGRGAQPRVHMVPMLTGVGLGAAAVTVGALFGPARLRAG